MSYQGIDVSRYQNPFALPYPAWIADGLRVVGIQVSHGPGPAPVAAEHLAVALAAHVPILFAYHYLTPGQIAQQVTVFLAALDPAFQFAALDVEDPDLTAEMILGWVKLFISKSKLPLVLYGNNLLAAAVAKYPEFTTVWDGILSGEVKD